MKTSDILWEAANEYLIDTHYSDDVMGKKCVFSCIAVAEVVYREMCIYDSETYRNVMYFLKWMGVNPDGAGEFNEFPIGRERQSARYAWLMFASMIAEEEGL